ncbi:MFS transporter [Sphingomicrobium flavum]|uniref:MFS transporter n=1 Tax=Sphingomicrobium flavum TaxID=1229164 RepID=UPI0021ADD50C|nr:MFS transporter [Sphingomicrobium flavum]
MDGRQGVLRKGELIGYGAGDFASNLYFSFFGLFLLSYYTDVVGLQAGHVATIFLATRIFDAVTDPAMGMLADRTRTRWGRYRPYLLWIALPFAIAGPLMFMVPDASYGVKLGYVVGTYMLVMLLYTAINVPYSALMGVISPQAAQRERASTFRFIGALGAALVLAAFTRPLVAWTGGGDEARGFALTASIYAVIAFVLFIICFATTRERVEPRPQSLEVKKDLKVLFGLTPWRLLAIGSVLLITAIAARISMVVHFFKYVAMDSTFSLFGFDDTTSLFMTASTIAGFIGAISAGRLIKQWGKQPIMVATLLTQCAMSLGLWLTPPDQFLALTALQIIFNFCFGVQLVAMFAMFTDTAEYADYECGRQMTGLVMSASQFAMKMGGALGGALPAYLMEATGFIANTQLDDLGQLGVRLGFIAVPGICTLLAALIFWRYPLRRARIAEIEAVLATRRSAAA